MLNVYLVVDRSGSMSSRWDETIGSLNGYVETLQSEKVEGTITVAVFDSNEPFKIIRDKASIPYFEKLTTTEITPRGMTPLYDAAGKAIALAEEANAEKTVVVVMTDGHENSSREFNQTSVKAAVKRITDRGWEVIFLGANFDVSSYGAGLGLDATKFANTADGNMAVRMRSMAMKSSGYVTGQAMNFSEEEKNELS